MRREGNVRQFLLRGFGSPERRRRPEEKFSDSERKRFAVFPAERVFIGDSRKRSCSAIFQFDILRRNIHSTAKQKKHTMNTHRNKNRSARFLARAKGVKGLLAAPALLFAAGMFSAGVPAANAADAALDSSVTSGDYSADNLSVAAGTIEFGGDAFAEISGTTTLASGAQFTISSSGTPLDFGDVRFDSAATASDSITVSASDVVFSSVLATSEGRLYVSEGADLLVSGDLSLAQATVSGTLTLNGVATVKGLVVSETSGRVVGDVTVSGASSALPISVDGRIEGDLSVVNSGSGVSHTIRGVVTGDVSANSGKIDLVGGTIGGDVNLSQGGGIELSDGASVAGTISHSSGIVTLNEGTSAGGLSIDTATAYVYGATIDGTLRATGGSLIFLEDRNEHQLTVTGSVEIVNTDPSSLTGLAVQGDAEFGGDFTLSGSVNVVMVDGFVSVAGTTRISDGARLTMTRLRSAEGDPAPELGRVEVSGGGADGTVHFTQNVGATAEIVAKDAASLTIGGGTVGALFAENACEINFSGGEIGVVDVFDGVDFNQTGVRVREVILGDGTRWGRSRIHRVSGSGLGGLHRRGRRGERRYRLDQKRFRPHREQRKRRDRHALRLLRLYAYDHGGHTQGERLPLRSGRRRGHDRPRRGLHGGIDHVQRPGAGVGRDRSHPSGHRAFPRHHGDGRRLRHRHHRSRQKSDDRRRRPRNRPHALRRGDSDARRQRGVRGGSPLHFRPASGEQNSRDGNGEVQVFRHRQHERRL